jgi:hypothetical protein
MEFPWALGPADGRYVIRDAGEEQPSHVLVLATLAAPERRRLRAKRPRDAEPEPDPVAVTTSRATVIDATPIEDEAAATRWLAGADDDELVAHGVRVLNTALQAQRVATADPYLREVGRDQALVVRVGFGAGEDVADGRWIDAHEAPPPKPTKRRAALSPQERLAALLGRREEALACEELTLRARADLDAGRNREAAIQLHAALETALSELGDEDASIANRIADLRERRAAIEEMAAEAAGGELSPDQAEEAGETLRRLEATLRARTTT